jgi:uncharacterized integral membrane protein
MKAKGVAYIVAAVLIGVFVMANWTLLIASIELNLLVAHVQAPLGVLILLVAGVILLADLAVHALSEHESSRERRALRQELDDSRLRADREEESRTAALRISMDRELSLIRGQLDQLLAGQSALLGRPPAARSVERPIEGSTERPRQHPIEPELVPVQRTAPPRTGH